MWKHPYVARYSFALALLLFIFPWIEIRCDAPRGGPFSGQGIDTIITSQSGLQMCYVGLTTTVNHLPLTPEQRKQAEQQKENRKLSAPAISLYGLALVVGLTASLTVKRSRRRFQLVCASCGVALVVLFIQLAIGFPLVEGVPPRTNGNGWSYTIWFWLGPIAVSTALISAVAQRLAQPFPDPQEPASEPLSPEAWARIKHRIAVGSASVLGCLLLVLFILFVWPGFLRPLPQAGMWMSGHVQYMLSDEHIQSVKLGMTPQEVQDVLDIAQVKMKPQEYLQDAEWWHKQRKSDGKSNLSLFESSLGRMAPYEEYWFRFRSHERTLSVRIKDGKVVEIKDSKEETP